MVKLAPENRAAPRALETQRWNGMRIGLLGGSFNPPHQGHVHASLIAMKYLNLDAIWWLVTPGNPLKPKADLPSLHDRMEACRALTDTHPAIIISSIEESLGTVRTYQTIKALKKRFSRTDFIWLSGTDIAYEFRRWYRWEDLIEELPFAFIGRPTHHGLVRNNPFRMKNQLHHQTLNHGINPELKPRQVFWIFGEPLNPLSSSMLRARMSDLQPESEKSKI